MLNYPIFYIDTNIIRDCIKNRKSETLVALDYIKENKWKCYTSMFALMEESDIEKEFIFFNKRVTEGMDINRILRDRYNKDLGYERLGDASNIINQFLTKYKFIEIYNIVDNSSWDKAVEASHKSNLSSADIIHLITAGESKCNILLTSDNFFIKEGKKFLDNIKEATPKFCKPNKNEILTNLKALKVQIGVEYSTR